MAFAIDKNKIAKNTVALYIRMGFTMIVSFFTARVTLQILGIEDYGLNNVVGSIVALFSFINGSIGTAVQRFYSIEIGKKNKKGLNEVVGVGIFLHRIVALISFVLCEVFAIFFLSELNIPSERIFAAHIVFQISAVSFVLNILNVPYAALLRARELFSKIALVEIVQAGLRLLVLFFLFVIDYDKLIVLSLLNFGVSIFYFISIYLLASKYEESKAKALYNRCLIKKMLNFVSMLIFTVLASLGRDQGIILLINIFFGLTVNAAYAVAMQVMSVISTFIMNFKQSVVPQIMSAYGAKDLISMEKLINSGTKFTFLLLLMISLPIYFEVDFILRIWLTTPPEYTSELVRLVIININVSSFTYFLYQGVHASGNITKQQISISLIYGINVLLIYCGFKFGFNFTSALYISILASFLQCIVNVYFSYKNYGYNIICFMKNILLKCFMLLSLSLIFVYFIIKIKNELMEIISIVLFSIIGLSVLGFFIILDKHEKSYLTNLMKMKFEKIRY